MYFFNLILHNSVFIISFSIHLIFVIYIYFYFQIINKKFMSNFYHKALIFVFLNF